MLRLLLLAQPALLHNHAFFFFFQAEDGIRDYKVTGVQTCALPICDGRHDAYQGEGGAAGGGRDDGGDDAADLTPAHFAPVSWSEVCRSEEHTSELQSPCNLVCRLLLEKKKKRKDGLYIIRHVRRRGP